MYEFVTLEFLCMYRCVGLYGCRLPAVFDANHKCSRGEDHGGWAEALIGEVPMA